MTDRELRLRTKIDALSDEKEALAKRVAELERRARQRPNRCQYCGEPTRGSRACPSHRDLLTLEWVAA